MNSIEIKAVLLKQGSIEPQGLVNQCQGLSNLVHFTNMIHDITLCLESLCTNQYISIYIYFEFEENKAQFFCNYKGLDECMYVACGGHYLRQGKEPLNYD